MDRSTGAPCALHADIHQRAQKQEHARQMAITIATTFSSSTTAEGGLVWGGCVGRAVKGPARTRRGMKKASKRGAML